MKKIAIVTINDYNNYGNRLQNYALQEALKKLGNDPITLISDTSENKYKQKYKKENSTPLKKVDVKRVFKRISFMLKKQYNKNKINKYYPIRIENFKAFTKKNIAETEYSVSETNIPKNLSNEYDFFVTGSDQVWNPNYRFGSSIDFLTFAPIEKRVAYAPSFGISEIPNEYIEKYKDWLGEMKYLSVREDSGANIIKKLTGKEVPVVIDPTLLLDKDEWLAILEESDSKPKVPYLITYFIGEISKENKKKINEIAKIKKMKIINLADINEPNVYVANPSEFIDYINSAEIFCTDSFHGAIFSMILDTPLVIFDRKDNEPSMNTRIETLVKTFKLENRKEGNILEKELFSRDYTHAIPILEEERKKSYEYLKNALNSV